MFVSVTGMQLMRIFAASMPLTKFKAAKDTFYAPSIRIVDDSLVTFGSGFEIEITNVNINFEYQRI